MPRLDFTQLKQYQDRTVQNEFYAKETGVIDFFKMHTPACPVLSSTLVNKLSTVATQAVGFPALIEQVITTTNVESFVIPQNLSESEEILLTSISIFSGYRIYESLFYDNIIGRADYEQNKLDEVFQAMADAKEAQLVAFLNAEKTQILPELTAINNDSGTFVFQLVTDTLEIDKAAQQNMMFGNLKTAMRLNNRPGEISLLSNEGGFNLALNTIARLGQANDSNLQNPRNDVPRMFSSLNISPAGDQFSAFMATMGAVGMVQNFPPDFVRRENTADSEWGITPFEIPAVKAKVNVFFNKVKTDASGLGGSSAQARMTTYEEWGFLDKFFLVSRYNSDKATKVGNIVKLRGLTT